MKKVLSLLLLICLVFSVFTGCSSKEKVTIISSSEEFRNEYMKTQLTEKFPQYDIEFQYMSTGTHAAKLKAEGETTDCDIVVGLESAYLQQNAATLADLSAYDTSAYLPELLPADHTYLPWERYSGCIVIREDLLEEKGLSIPQSYADLLKPEYENLVVMPNPKASGTGYMFLLSLVNAWGEDEAFQYFDSLAPNLVQFTSSGSGPVNSLISGEAAIGLGMTFQSVEEINKGIPLSIHYFEEGAPYNTTGFAMVKGKDSRPAVKEVFDYFASTLLQEDKEKFSPEPIFVNQDNAVENYPQAINYADMNTEDALATKEALLEKWKH